jgi:protoporphyrinogen oxidase
MTEPTLIIGAGLAGLSCARHLGKNCILLEKESEPGGTARSFDRDGFVFDITGHWLHLTDDDVRALVEELLGSELVNIERRAEIHLDGVRTPYPFQANTHGRPPSLVAECVLGYFAARETEARGGHPPPETFEDYIRQKMGDGIARHFMIPYNTKLWTVPPSEMSHAWCQRFVPIPSPTEVVLGALQPGGANAALGYNASFSYPRAGGIGRLPRALASSLAVPLRTGAAVTSIDWRERRARAGDDVLGYDALVSTMPLPDLVATLVDPPSAVTDAAAELRATSVTYWDVGVAGANPPGAAHWVCFPEASIPFYRAGSASAAVPSVAPAGHRSYYVEVSHARGTACPTRDEEVLSAMRTVGLLAADEEPVLLHRTTIDCAYVIMDAAYGRARATILDWLSSQRILSIGRYGDWTYDSMEGAMIQGRDAAARVRELP